MELTAARRLVQRARWAGDACLNTAGRLTTANSILDGVGQILAAIGSTTTSEPLRQAFGSESTPGSFPVWPDKAVLRRDLAVVFGALIHSSDWDDIGGGGGHPTAVLLPAMIVEHIGRTRTPDETVAAYAAGYEAASLSLDALGPRGRKQLRGPWQPASLVGPIGSAVATGLLRGSSDDVMSDGLIIAASFAAGLQANFGSNLKPLQLGRASALGREAILLAEAGFRPEPELLERDNGFAAAFGQQPDWISAPRWAGEEPVLLSGAGGETVGQGPWIKLFPACGGTNPVATAALQIVDEVGLTADQIAAVVVVENRDRSRGALFRVEPQSPEEARFSLRFVVAAAFILRRLDPAAFTEEAFHQVTNHRLWPLIRVEIRPGEDEASETTVRVTSTGGETHERHVLGRGRVADDDEVTSKFRSCAKPTVGAAVAESVVKLMRDSSGPNLSGALASIWQ